MAQADVGTGTIYKVTDPVNGAGTTVDYWAFSLGTPANIEFDVRANEGVVTAWGSPPGAYRDLNGDGEITLADTQFRLYQDTVTADTEIAAGDDSGAYTLAHDTNGWGDGTLSVRDSYLATALDVGNYIVAFGDYSLTTAEAVLGFNTGDALSGATGINPFTGATGQDHFDYRLLINATDFDTGVPVNVGLHLSTLSGGAQTGASASPVPVPAAVWLFASALGGISMLGRRKSI